MAFNVQSAVHKDYAVTAFDFGSGGVNTFTWDLPYASAQDTPKYVTVNIEVINKSGAGLVDFQLVSPTPTQVPGGTDYLAPVPTTIAANYGSTTGLLAAIGTATSGTAVPVGNVVAGGIVTSVVTGNKFSLRMPLPHTGKVVLRAKATTDATIRFVASAYVEAYTEAN
jgi:hypothetical protein